MRFNQIDVRCASCRDFFTMLLCMCVYRPLIKQEIMEMWNLVHTLPWTKSKSVSFSFFNTCHNKRFFAYFLDCLFFIFISIKILGSTFSVFYHILWIFLWHISSSKSFTFQKIKWQHCQTNNNFLQSLKFRN